MNAIKNNYLKELLKLAWPIMLGNLGVVLLGAGDCIIAGKYSTSALAAISIANAIHSILMMLGIGLTVSISPLLSNKRGERQNVKKYFFPSIRFAIVISIVLTVLTLLYIPLLDYLHYEPGLLSDIKQYTFVVAFSIIGVEISIALKEFLQSYEIVVFPNIVMICCVFLNLFLNYTLVFGTCFMPRLGLAGLAVATVLVRFFNAFMLLLFCFLNFSFEDYCEKDYYKQLIKIGLPISAAVMIEFLSFNYIAIILGKLSGVYAAAHNIAIVLISATYMLPFGLSNALAVKVGYANGAKNYSEMKGYIRCSLIFTAVFMTFACLMFVTFPSQLAGLFTNDAIVISVLSQVMGLVALFELTDGLQTIFSGVFKGLKKTKFVMIANFVAYLVVGVSLGTYFGLYLKMNLFGCWIGVCASSVILSVLLGSCLFVILKKYNTKKIN